MRASIVIVTYNHRRHIGCCLAALGPTLGADDEVLVVDNASTDGTAEIVAHHAGVRLQRLARNVGFGAACNLGARLSRAETLVFLNPDTEPQPGWLDALLRALQSGPNMGLVTAKLLLASAPERIDAFGNDLHISGIPTCHGWGEPAGQHAALEEVAAVSGACFAVRRDLFTALGGFDERFFLYYEDDDLSLRARLAGWRCIGVPDAHVVHDHRPGVSPAKLRYLERNRWWSLLKLYQWPTLLALLPVLLGAELIAWGLACRSGPRHMAAKAQAWLDLVAWLPALPAARAAARPHRRLTDAALLRLHGPRLPFAQVDPGALARLTEVLAHRAFSTGRALALLSLR